jgi:proteasome lid subunit RPN8/RPN11
VQDRQIELASDRAEHIEVAWSAASKMRTHARREYPVECCGVLLGVMESQPDRGVKSVVSVIPSLNVAMGDRASRFTIAPELLLRVHKRVAGSPIDVVGYYHSHPDGSAIPSERDREAAWPGVSYLIIGVEAGSDMVFRSWRLSEDGARFREEIVGVSRQPELER